MLKKLLDKLFGTVESEYRRGRINAIEFMATNPTSGEFMQYWGSAEGCYSFPQKTAKQSAYDRGSMEVLKPHFAHYPELEGLDEL